jgi:flagellar biogenesis protein FliO
MLSDWTYTRKLTSAWPEPVEESKRSVVLLAIAIALVLAAAFVTARFGRPRRRPPAPAQ